MTYLLRGNNLAAHAEQYAREPRPAGPILYQLEPARTEQDVPFRYRDREWGRPSLSVVCQAPQTALPSRRRRQKTIACATAQQSRNQNLWGGMESGAPVGNRRSGPIANRPQVNNLPHSGGEDSTVL